MLSINHNLSVLKSQNNLFSATNSLSISLERMATSFRINSAKDDAAGMFVATKINTQILGLNQARKNAQNGMAVLSMAEGSLSNITNLLNRVRDLAVQGANGVYDADSRLAMQNEANALVEEMVRVKNSTVFNGKQILGNSQNPVINTFNAPPRNPIFLA